MVRDRTKQFQEAMSKQIHDDSDEKFIVTIQDADTDLENFFKFVDIINENIGKMDKLVDDMVRIQLKMMAISNEDVPKNALDDININFKIASKKTKEALNDIKNELINLEKKNEKNSAAYRIRSTQYTTLSKKVCDVITKYNIAQSDYRDKCKQHIKRQFEIKGVTPTDQEMDELIENPNPEIFIQGHLNQLTMARQQLEEINARHQDIVKIEKSVRELHEMFTDMANLVAQQGEMIDRIETQVTNTYDYVAKASAETKAAMEYKKRSRKFKICIALILIIILAIVVAVLCWQFIPSNNHSSSPSATVAPSKPVAA